MKRLLLIMIMILAVLVAGCTTMETSEDETSKEVTKVNAAASTSSVVLAAPVAFTQVEVVTGNAKENAEVESTVEKTTAPSTPKMGVPEHELQEVVYCEDVPYESIERNCFSHVPYIIAVASKDLNFCNNLKDDYRKSECLTYLEAIQPTNEE